MVFSTINNFIPQKKCGFPRMYSLDHRNSSDVTARNLLSTATWDVQNMCWMVCPWNAYAHMYHIPTSEPMTQLEASLWSDGSQIISNCPHIAPCITMCQPFCRIEHAALITEQVWHHYVRISAKAEVATTSLQHSGKALAAVPASNRRRALAEVKALEK